MEIRAMTVITATYTQAESIFPAATSEYTAIGRVRVFPAIFPAIMAVAPNSPRPLAKAKTPPPTTPGMAFGRRTFRNMAHSPIPRVRAAAGRLGSTCSKAPLAERYISGKDMVTAAMTVADQEKAILILK